MLIVNATCHPDRPSHIPVWRKRKSRFRGLCTDCYRDAVRAYQRAYKQQRRRGLSDGQWAAMLARQGGLCATCRSNAATEMDRIQRVIVCRSCNRIPLRAALPRVINSDDASLGHSLARSNTRREPTGEGYRSTTLNDPA